MRGKAGLDFFLKHASGPVLDIGSGEGEQAGYLRAHGVRVVTLDNKADADIQGDFQNAFLKEFYPAIHCCHVLEHQRNPGEFLDKIYRYLQDDGWLCITVPPLKHEIVGGHVSLWNAGLLVYHLVLAGFDCADAYVRTEGYDVSVVVQKKPADLSGIHMACGDIELLSKYFPWQDVRQGFHGVRYA